MSESIGKIARRFGLSRSTLLYYDRLKLLSPTGRSASGYRLYDGRDAKRLEAICQYRSVGLTLKQVRELLEGTKSRSAEVLAAHLDHLNAEIGRLRDRQRTIVRLLADPEKLRHTRAMDKERWVGILRAAGLDDEGMHRWHVEFERIAPEAHRDFLESLGLRQAEIHRVRRWSRADALGPG